MRIVQTFWTAGRDPLEHSFGWLRPEYNLMSWALSCLSLREHYDEVALYTDEQGKHVLVDLLHLPYTEVNVVYDEHLCLPQHWAYAKIKTYSLQTKPFLHVDGDVYLPKPIPEEVISAPLIAQNREIGTIYYKRMMDRILQKPAIKLPTYIEEALRKESIASYNMGVFGGSDLEFIHHFCAEAVDFMEKNYMNDGTRRQSFIDCNVFFEQVIFGVMADRYGKEVASVIGRAVRDEGYTRQEFCNFNRYKDSKLLHLLGGHKRNKSVTQSIEKFFLIQHKDLVERILKVVCKRNRYNCLSCRRVPVSNAIYRLIPDFEKFISEIISMYRQTVKHIPLHEERRRLGTLPCLDIQKEHESIVKRTTGLSVFSLSENIPQKDVEKLKILLGCERNFPLTHLAVYPSLRQDMLEIVPLEDMCFGILMELEGNTMTVDELTNYIIHEFCRHRGTVSESLLIYAMQHIKYLINMGTLLLEN